MAEDGFKNRRGDVMYRIDNVGDLYEAIKHLIEASKHLEADKLILSNTLLETANSVLEEIENSAIECDQDKIDQLARQILKKRQRDIMIFEKDYNHICHNRNPISSYTIEFTTTNACNWRCDYCFEDGCDRSTMIDNVKIPTLIRKTKEFLNSEFFHQNLQVLKIDFWGGEPFMNPEPVKRFIEEFMHDERVVFHAYTNGSMIDPLLDIFQEASIQPSINNQKILIQFSYDGAPIHNLRRKDKHGRATGEKTIQQAMKTANMGIPVSFKATLMIKDFDQFTDAWDDYHNRIFPLFKDYGHITYSPTIDYTQDYNEVDLRKDVLEKQLVDIASKEIEFYKKEGRFLLSWFSSGSSLCTAGRNMTCVDTNGDLYYCHGAMYESNKADFIFGNIYNHGFVNKLVSNYNKFFECNQSTPDECAKCVADSCYRCNVQKYQSSQKSEFMEKWMDFTCMKEMCNYFKLIGEIKFALMKNLTEDI